MKPIRLLAVFLPVVFLGGYACTHKSTSDNSASGGPGDGSGAPGDNGSSGAPGSSGAVDPNKNPIDGIAPPAVLIDTGVYTDGPVWDASQNALFFTAPLGGPNSGLYLVREDGSAMQVRPGDETTGALPIGNTIDPKTHTLITFEVKRVMKGSGMADAGAAVAFSTGYVDPDAGAAGAPFDSLNDGVLGPTGSLYVTDPGYYGTPIANRIYKIDPSGKATVVDQFDDIPRPNGIALSPDQKTLYVGFTQPLQGTNPYVRKYDVAADGSLGTHTNFISFDAPDAAPDGIEVDQAGNLYVATKTGVQVFKADGSKIGIIALPDQPTGMAFGSKDLQTLFITTQGTKIYTVHLNVPGVVQ